MSQLHVPRFTANGLPKARIGLDQRSVLVGTNSIQIAGPNQRRAGLILSSGPENFTNVSPISKNAQHIDTSTTGVKLSFTVIANTVVHLSGATFQETTGTGVISQLRWTPNAGVATVLQNFTTQGTYVGGLELNQGDVVDWNVQTAIAASFSDFTISLNQVLFVGRVTISFKRAAAVDVGINLHPGQHPLVLMQDYLGDAIREDVFAVTSQGTTTLGILDLFEP